MAKEMRVPPQNIEAEKALLGSIMLRPELIYDIGDIITPDSFYSTKHAIIFRTMLSLHTNHTPIDIISLSSKLKEIGQLDQVGGATYLSDILESVPTAANANYYAEIVHKKATMRRLIEAAENISQLGYDEAKELEEILEKAEKDIFEVTNFKSANKFVSIGDSLTEAMERFDKLHSNEGEMRGVPTGFPSLDNKLSGFQPSDLIILAARPSMGKTSLALDIARHTATRHGTPVGIFSLEMSAQQLIDRMIAAEANVDSWKLRTGKLRDEEDFQRITEASDTLSKAPIFIDDQPGSNIMKMRSVSRRMKSEHGLGMIIVDYLQLMNPTQSRNSDNVVQQITEISRSLKGLARELDVPVLALSQLSRAVESRGGRPRLSDLRDSGSIEQDADIVAFIHNETKYAKDESERSNITEILIEKHRNGPTGKVELYFDNKKSSFHEIDKSSFGSDIDAF